jgi:hypothetical protein
MLILDDEYLQMARDYEAMERRAVEDAEELRQLREGQRIVVPRDVEHARTMFKLASYYLSHHDPEFALDLA